jgi:hypothetical protein
MENTTQHNTTQHNVLPADTLAAPLRSALVVPMDSTKGKTASHGHRFAKLIAKGKNTKLTASSAVEVPCFKLPTPNELDSYPALREYLTGAFDGLVNSRTKELIVGGATIVQYSDLALSYLNSHAAALNESNGIGQLSEAGIKTWFDSDAREIVIEALKAKIGISDSLADPITEADVKRLEQIANQLRDNLAKLSSKKPVHFDERVRKALNMALEVSDIGDSMTARLLDKLNVVVSDDDALLNLGL